MEEERYGRLDYGFGDNKQKKEHLNQEEVEITIKGRK
jgi:hypothetical protein